MTHHQGKLCFVGIFIIYVLSWFLQSRLLLSWDASWGLHETEKLLGGGKYVKDFFEMTPPLFLYLFMPVVLVKKWFAINTVIIFRVYFFLISAISLSICYPLVQKIFSERHASLALIFSLMIAVVFLLLPLPFDFGQREHLLIILTMPYFLAVTYRLQGNSLLTSTAIIIGILAGLGFAIKPFFLITFIFIELYCIHTKNSLLAWVRAETLAILGLLALYTPLVIIYFQEYLRIIPIAMRLYYQGYNLPLTTLALRPEFIFCCLGIVFHVVHYNKNPYKIFCNVFLIGLIGFLFSYLMQHTYWYYHLLPGFSMGILLFVVLFGTFAVQDHTRKIDYLLMTALGFLLFEFLFYCANNIGTIIIFFPKVFFCFFAILFALLFYLTQSTKNLFKVFISTLFITAVAFLFSYLMKHDNWYAYRFFTTFVLLLLLFSLFVPKSHVKKSHIVFTAILGILIFSFPVYSATLRYWSGIIYNEKMGGLIAFLRNNAWHKPVYFFSTQLSEEFPAVDYAEAIPASRYPVLFWLPGLVKQLRIPLDNNLYLQLMQDKKFLIDIIAQELNTNKPVLVLVDAQKNKGYLEGINFNYINYFSENQQMRTAWKPYHYLTTIEDAPLYKFQVYGRKDVAVSQKSH